MTARAASTPATATRPTGSSTPALSRTGALARRGRGRSKPLSATRGRPFAATHPVTTATSSAYFPRSSSTGRKPFSPTGMCISEAPAGWATFSTPIPKLPMAARRAGTTWGSPGGSPVLPCLVVAARLSTSRTPYGNHNKFIHGDSNNPALISDIGGNEYNSNGTNTIFFERKSGAWSCPLSLLKPVWIPRPCRLRPDHTWPTMAAQRDRGTPSQSRTSAGVGPRSTRTADQARTAPASPTGASSRPSTKGLGAAASSHRWR